MLVAEHVQCTVNHKSDQLFLYADAIAHDLRRSLRAYVYVADEPTVGLQQRVRDHVRQAATSCRTPIQATHRDGGQQRDVHM